MKLLEDRAKSWLRGRGLPVPLGRTADSAEQASAVAAELGGRVAVKALVATGRRGKAGGVRLVSHPDAAHAAARELLGSDVAGHRCTRVYVEKAIAIQEELYLSFGFGTMAPEAVVSRRGGVDIEQVAAGHPAELVRFKIDPLRGVAPWCAADLWDRAGVQSKQIPSLAALTSALYEAFCAADALMFEVNPMAVGEDGSLSVVGAMLEIDDNALFRHPEWRELGLDGVGSGGRPLNERELAVIEADRKFPGGAIRYTEVHPRGWRRRAAPA